MEAEVAILGAGTAGATAALNLARSRQVTIIDQHAEPLSRIGESLPGAARRLLIHMGLWPAFLAAGHLPRHCLRSAWGGFVPTERDGLTDPDGHGWQLDRKGFESQLRCEAVARGARLIAPATIRRVERTATGWRISCVEDAVEGILEARILIDATGRTSRRLTSLGAHREISDRLHCAWLRAIGGQLPSGVVQIEAEANGWWYAANAPGAAILAFHTDTDLPAANRGRTRDFLLSAARTLPMLAEHASAKAWSDAQHGICSAHGVSLEPAAGDAWMAVGDSAFASDPLGAQGLFNALYFGLAAAEAADRTLCGDSAASADYADEVRRVRNAYSMNLAAWYRVEQRWTDQPFWQRRHTRGKVAA